MGFAGIKIPGHSGTDFKNKKVYAKAEKLLNDQPIFIDVRLEQRESKPTYPWYSVLKKGFTFLILSTFILLLIDYSFYNEPPIPKKQKEIIPFLTSSEKHRAVVVMFNSAQYHYDAKEYDEAQNEITRVLHLYPHDLESIELMHKILTKQCELKNKFCRDAMDYQDYLHRVKTK